MRGRRLVVALVLAASMYAASPAAEPYGPQSFAGNTGWLNSAPIDAHALRGSLVLVDFWEYTCVNCLRTLPYLREWYKRYAKYGFTIVGVHTPEFDFSAQPANVQAAVRRLDIDWPVVMDANLAIWNQYRNDGWPHEYLYDRSGRLVESIFGEGRYQDTERAIQRLLEAGGVHGLPPLVPLLPQDSYTKPGAVCYPQTAELIVKHVPVGKCGRVRAARRRKPISGQRAPRSTAVCICRAIGSVRPTRSSPPPPAIRRRWPITRSK